MACWIAFALATVLSMMTFLLQSLSDPFNWGWNLLGMAGSRWHIIWSPAIPWLQVACVLIGAAYSHCGRSIIAGSTARANGAGQSWDPFRSDRSCGPPPPV